MIAIIIISSFFGLFVHADVSYITGLNYPAGININSLGNVFISDNGHHCIRKVDTFGVKSTIVGLCGTNTNSFSGDGGPSNKCKIILP